MLFLIDDEFMMLTCPNPQAQNVISIFEQRNSVPEAVSYLIDSLCSQVHSFSLTLSLCI